MFTVYWIAAGDTNTSNELSIWQLVKTKLGLRELGEGLKSALDVEDPGFISQHLQVGLGNILCLKHLEARAV